MISKLYLISVFLPLLNRASAEWTTVSLTKEEWAVGITVWVIIGLVCCCCVAAIIGLIICLLSRSGSSQPPPDVVYASPPAAYPGQVPPQRPPQGGYQVRPP